MNRVTVIAAVMTFLGALSASGQNAIELREKPVTAQMLAGTVRVGDGGGGAKGVLVERCTRDWKVVVSSTTTDEDGHFEFPGIGQGTRYLRFSAAGVITTLLKVRISKWAPKEMSIAIRFAT
jgi:hypothetical protein